MRYLCIILVLAGLLLLLRCAPHEVKPGLAGEETVRLVKLEVTDQVLYYRCQSSWSAEKFAELSQDDLKRRFEVKYDVDAREFQFSFDSANHSTIIQCRIYGIITKSGDRYTADLLWLLRPHQLDFIDDDFEESKTGLSWEGTVNDVRMSIEVKCPQQDSVYEAWQHPVGHCHGHIWWPASR